MVYKVANLNATNFGKIDQTTICFTKFATYICNLNMDLNIMYVVGLQNLLFVSRSTKSSKGFNYKCFTTKAWII
jgi:hypothetical protein